MLQSVVVVSTDNFNTTWDDIVLHSQHATFVALDTEFTGMGDDKSLANTKCACCVLTAYYLMLSETFRNVILCYVTLLRSSRCYKLESLLLRARPRAHLPQRTK